MSMLAETTPATPTVAEAYMFVIGVDTHARAHVYSVIESSTGAVVDTQSFPPALPGSPARRRGSLAVPSTRPRRS
ncbi:hypothetical protein EDD34_2341 [Myceligenerans xiligouense]|uniref:Transposase n=1 Tax=Myceligenerans xiligouense TaxID=253184 RepID=A0A3N4Z7A4_9MICO|nr:hypothetical protein EDD34_2341 [Myceligenerans xiligouense]